MITRIAHIGIAVRDLAGANEIFETILGFPRPQPERVEEQKVDVASFHVGGTQIELTCGTSADSPITRFIEKRGEGIHHIAFETDDIEAELERLSRAGVTLIDTVPRRGADGMRIAFLHPKSANGVLVELCEKPKT
ncbi:MAG: methylmalonyl-CoA epimerase [Bacteroidota bacterium]|nr:methylmalonyl-CoA epimerase [Bacteroidota bacterium]